MFLRGRPVWMAVYCGRVDDADVDAVYSFLQRALREAPADFPIRGPKALTEGQFSYRNVYEGTVASFSAHETIHESERTFYAAHYAGGLVDDGVATEDDGRMRPNPLAENPITDTDDRACVLRAKAGNRAALEELAARHQAWIYNIAVRMLYHPQDAEDATQAILVKALTAFSSYEGRSSFSRMARPRRRQPRAECQARTARAADHKLQLLRSRTGSRTRSGSA